MYKAWVDLLLSTSLQKQCKAFSNKIKSLPDTISIFWRTQLQEVDFSDNSLTELPSYIFELEVNTIFWIFFSTLACVLSCSVKQIKDKTPVCDLWSSLQVALLFCSFCMCTDPSVRVRHDYIHAIWHWPYTNYFLYWDSVRLHSALHFVCQVTCPQLLSNHTMKTV